MAEFPRWLWSVFFRATNVVTGGVVAFGVEVYDKIHSQSPATVTTLLWIAAACFVWGSFRTWTEKDEALKSLDAELAHERDRNTPRLEAELGAPIYVEYPAINRLLLVLPITVRNRPPGAPSAAEHWRVGIEQSGGLEWFTTERLNNGLTINTASGQFTLPESDDIVPKTKLSALGTGDSRGGYVAVLLAGKSQTSIHGATVTVAFTDVCGTPYSARLVADTQNLTSNLSVLSGTAARFTMTPQAAADLFAQGTPRQAPPAHEAG